MIPFTVRVNYSPEAMQRMCSLLTGLSDGTAKDILLDITKEVTTSMRRVALINSPRGNRPKDEPRLKESWTEVDAVDGGYAFANTKPYAHVLEYGLYPSVGKSGLTVAGTYAGVDTGWNSYGIFSTQAPSGMLGIMETDGTFDAAVSDILEGMSELFDRGRL